MNQREFDAACAALERDGRKAIKGDCEQRVFIAVAQVMRQRLRMPDNQPYAGPTDQELKQFFAGIDRRQRRLLKQIADGLIKETVPVAPGSGEMH